MSIKQSDITTICQNRSKRTDAGSLANFKTCLNSALEWLSMDFVLDQGVPFACLKVNHEFTITDGEYREALPDDFVAFTDDDPTLIDGQDETRMTKKDKDWFSDNYPNQVHTSASKSEPYYFYIDEDYFYFNKSNGSYTIVMPYARLHPALADDTSVIYFPNRFKQLLAELTLWKFYDDLDNEEKSNKHYQLAQIELTKLNLINKRNAGRTLSTIFSDI